MNKYLTKIPLITLCAAAILVVPALSRAQDTSTPSTTTNAPATPAPKKHAGVIPYHGTLDSVDTNAMSFAVGTRTFEVTSDTKITKDGKPAVLADGVVGQPVSGAYKKNADGKLDAITVHFGMKKSKSAATPPAPTAN